MECAVVIWKGNRPSIAKVADQLRNEFGQSQNVKEETKFMLLYRPSSGFFTITECDELDIIKFHLRTFALQLRVRCELEAADGRHLVFCTTKVSGISVVWPTFQLLLNVKRNRTIPAGTLDTGKSFETQVTL